MMDQSISAILHPGQVTELRAFMPRNGRGFSDKYSGYYDDVAELLSDAKKLDEQGATGIYFIPNPVNPALLARSVNRARIIRREPCTTNEDIEERRWLLLDFDPERPAGVSATDEEKKIAKVRMREAAKFLQSIGFSEPIVGDSGNGYHLNYRIEPLPADDDLCERVTKALARKFSDELVNVDEAVHNAARIWKLYGTMARKGDDTPERPHRRSQILYEPDEITATPHELLEAVAAEGKEEPKKSLYATTTSGDGPSPDEEIPHVLSYLPDRLDYGDKKDQSYPWLVAIAGVLDKVGGDVYAAEAFLNARWPEEQEGEYAEKLANPLSRVGWGSVVNMAKESGYNPSAYYKDWHRRQGRRNGQATTRLVELPPQIGSVVADVDREHIRWLWPGRLALGKITILDGDPGLGKSTLYCDWIARHTTGRTLPGDAGPAEPGSAVIFTVEDGIGDTIRPRLEEAGADLSKVLVVQTVSEYDPETEKHVEKVPALPEDLQYVRQALVQSGAKLLVIDPLTAHLGADVNSHKDQDVRRAVGPLAKLAEDLDVAVLVIRHLNKQAGGNPMYRGGGSIGIIGAARLGMLLGRSPDEDDTLVLASTKSNLSRLPQSLSLKIVSSEHDPNVGVVTWLGSSPHSAYDVLNVKPPQSTPALDEAADWLRNALADGEPHKASEMWSQVEAAGLKERTVRKALKDLGVTVERIGGIADRGAWYWTLPEDDSNPATAPKAAAAANAPEDEGCSVDDLRSPNTPNNAALGQMTQKQRFNKNGSAALGKEMEDVPF